MSGNQNFAADYVQVNERIAAFVERYPEGSLQSELLELTETRVVMRGLAYRTPDDARPGIGTSSLTIPGKTPYTRDSEIENCETSAWGRALAALGFEVKRSVASADEIAMKAGTTRSAAPKAAPAPAAPAEAPAGPVTSHGWTEGQRHDPAHFPLKAKNGHLFCPTKLPNGAWCNWRADEAERPVTGSSIGLAPAQPKAEATGPAQGDSCGAKSVYGDNLTCNLLRGHGGPSHRVLDADGKAVSSWPVAA